MIEIRQTAQFSKWMRKLADRQAYARIQTRLRNVTLGNLGDVKPVREGVSEMRIDYGPGYRLYFLQRGKELIILLAGGDKGTQEKDIKAAIALAKTLKESP